MAIRLNDGATRRHRWVWALALAPVLLAVHWYLNKPLGAQMAFLVTFVLLGIIPAFAAPTFFGKRATALGLTIGKYRTGMTLLAAGIPLGLLAGLIGARSEALALVYPLGASVTAAVSSFAPYAFLYLLYYVGFEFFFRGFLLLGLNDRIGPAGANVLQAGLATMAHFGKPGVEIIAALPASLVFGWITLRTGSIWYAVVIHWVVGVSLDWFLLT